MKNSKKELNSLHKKLYYINEKEEYLKMKNLNEILKQIDIILNI